MSRETDQIIKFFNKLHETCNLGNDSGTMELRGIQNDGYSLSFLIRKWIIKFARKLQIGEK
jgi:hypothetical protein